MSDLENMSEVQDPNTQPVDAVAADTETTEATPQAEATERVEFYIEDEGGQDNQPNNFDDVAKRRAAFAKSKQKEREAIETAKAEKAERERIAQELADLRAQVSNVSRGPRPDPYDFESTEDFYKALDTWSSPQQANQTQQQSQSQPQQQVNQPQVDYNVEFDYQESANALASGGINDFSDKETEVKNHMQSLGINADAGINYIKNIAAQDGDIDSAKAIYMIGINPGVLQELMNVTDIQAAKIIKREAKKLKTRNPVQPSSQPTPTISGGGTIDNTAAGVEKLRQKWQETGSIKDYQAYKAARKQSQTK